MNAVDTNVLIYFYDERELKRRAIATEIVKSLRDGVLLWQVACEFIAASRRLSSMGLTPNLAWQRLGELSGFFRLVTPTPAVLDRAQILMAERQIQFWDAMIYAACLEAGVSHIYSEDLPGQAIPNLKITNPFA